MLHVDSMRPETLTLKGKRSSNSKPKDRRNWMSDAHGGKYVHAYTVNSIVQLSIANTKMH